MANLLYQQIEMLSREKHIEPEVVVSAIEDAMVVAARNITRRKRTCARSSMRKRGRWTCTRCTWSSKK